jgi:hypothetical protein
MTTKTKIMLSVLIILTLILAFSRFGDYRESTAGKIYQAEIKSLKAEIAGKQKKLADSEKRLKVYKEKYALADAKLRVITKPQTVTETKQRLAAMNYEVLPTEEICLSEESGKQIVVDLEKGKVCEEKLAVCNEITEELAGQKDTLVDIVALKDDQIKADEAIIEDQKQAIEENKPSVMDGVIKVLGGIGIGALLVLIL